MSIKEGDLIVDIEKRGVVINDEPQNKPVRCVKILDDQDLIWESLDGKSSACDSIYCFVKYVP